MCVFVCLDVVFPSFTKSKSTPFVQFVCKRTISIDILEIYRLHINFLTCTATVMSPTMTHSYRTFYEIQISVSQSTDHHPSHRIQ
jgi:hypothetical protein